MDKELGKKYGKLTILKYEFTDKYYYKHYLCKCECGNTKVINLNNLKGGKTQSCGCNYKTILGNLYKKKNHYCIKDNFVIAYTTNTNKEFYIDLDDYIRIRDVSWYEAQNGYIAHKDKNKKVILLHRFILNAPKNKIVDHINHNKNDNRKSNLRLTDYKTNALNRLKKPKGISKHKVGNNEYFVIQLNGYRGNYKTYDEAKRVRDEIIKKEYYLWVNYIKLKM